MKGLALVPRQGRDTHGDVGGRQRRPLLRAERALLPVVDVEESVLLVLVFPVDLGDGGRVGRDVHALAEEDEEGVLWHEAGEVAADERVDAAGSGALAEVAQLSARERGQAGLARRDDQAGAAGIEIWEE